MTSASVLEPREIVKVPAIGKRSAATERTRAMVFRAPRGTAKEDKSTCRPRPAKTWHHVDQPFQQCKPGCVRRSPDAAHGSREARRRNPRGSRRQLDDAAGRACRRRYTK